MGSVTLAEELFEILVTITKSDLRGVTLRRSEEVVVEEKCS